MSFKVLLVVFLGLLTLSSAKHWALLVAGSSDWWNYRHQADVCHVYQILHSHGIPDENIVVMMYDDIAYNPSNPHPGVIVNKPGGPNVYKGVPKDYTEQDVSSWNFLNVLTGDKEDMNGTGTGRVIESGPDDNIFVYFADHGEAGVLFFPNDQSQLMASELMHAISDMRRKKKFKKMVLYIEACKSGSMFNEKLSDDIQVFAATSANPHESSYGCGYDKDLKVYVSSVFSLHWTNNSEKADFQKETLLQQFNLAKQETNTSHVTKYGDMRLGNDVLDEFQGSGNGKQIRNYDFTKPSARIDDAVPSPDVPLMTLRNSLRHAKTQRERRDIVKKIEDLLETNDNIKATVEKIVSLVTESDEQKNLVLTKTADPRNFDCYKKVVSHFGKNCFNFGKYEQAIRYVHVMSNLCEESIQVDTILAAMSEVCAYH